MFLLILSILLLALGPLLSHFFHHQHSLIKWIDRITFVCIALVLFLHVIPESVHHAGWLAWVLLLIGFGVPTLAEKALHKAAATVHKATLAIGMLGLAAHGMLDGLSLTDDITVLSHGSLPALVLLHRIPVGQLIWALLRPSFGVPVALSVLALVAVSTVLGFLTGHHYAYLLHGIYFSLFQALVAGAILHVVLFRGHVHNAESHEHSH